MIFSLFHLYYGKFVINTTNINTIIIQLDERASKSTSNLLHNVSNLVCLKFACNLTPFDGCFRKSYTALFLFVIMMHLIFWYPDWLTVCYLLLFFCKARAIIAKCVTMPTHQKLRTILRAEGKGVSAKIFRTSYLCWNHFYSFKKEHTNT